MYTLPKRMLCFEMTSFRNGIFLGMGSGGFASVCGYILMNPKGVVFASDRIWAESVNIPMVFSVIDSGRICFGRRALLV
jgi:hypothetical protein